MKKPQNNLVLKLIYLCLTRSNELGVSASSQRQAMVQNNSNLLVQLSRSDIEFRAYMMSLPSLPGSPDPNFRVFDHVLTSTQAPHTHRHTHTRTHTHTHTHTLTYAHGSMHAHASTHLQAHTHASINNQVHEILQPLHFTQHCISCVQGV